MIGEEKVTWRFGQFSPEKVNKTLSVSCTACMPPDTEEITLEEKLEVFSKFLYQPYLVSPPTKKEPHVNISKLMRRLNRPI